MDSEITALIVNGLAFCLHNQVNYLFDKWVSWLSFFAKKKNQIPKAAAYLKSDFYTCFLFYFLNLLYILLYVFFNLIYAG